MGTTDPALIRAAQRAAQAAPSTTLDAQIAGLIQSLAATREALALTNQRLAAIERPEAGPQEVT